MSNKMCWMHLIMVTMRVGGPLVVWKHVITIKSSLQEIEVIMHLYLN